MTALEIPSFFSKISGMGVPEKIYPVRKFSRYGSVILAVIGLGGAAAVFTYSLIYALDQIQKNGPAVLETILFAPLFFFIMLTLVGLISLSIAISNWKKAAVLYKNGFAYSDRKGLKSFYWDEIKSIRSEVVKRYTNGIYTGTTHRYLIENYHGVRISLDDSLMRVEELASRIRRHTFPILYQRYSQAYNSGEPVIFGPVTISRSGGISHGKKSYPWDQIAAVTVERGSVQIAKKGGGWFSGTTLLAASIPNLEVMLAIIDRVIGVKMKRG